MAAARLILAAFAIGALLLVLSFFTQAGNSRPTDVVSPTESSPPKKAEPQLPPEPKGIVVKSTVTLDQLKTNPMTDDYLTVPQTSLLAPPLRGLLQFFAVDIYPTELSAGRQINIGVRGIDNNLNTYVSTGSSERSTIDFRLLGEEMHQKPTIRCAKLYNRRDGITSSFRDVYLLFTQRTGKPHTKTKVRNEWGSDFLNILIWKDLTVPVGTMVTNIRVMRRSPGALAFAELELFSDPQCTPKYKVTFDYQRSAGRIRLADDLTRSITNLTYQCDDARLLGGRHDGDGLWPVCMDSIRGADRCNTFSIGSENDFSFDDALARMGCNVATWDPTLGWPRTKVMRGDRIQKYGIGVSSDSQLNKRGTHLGVRAMMERAGFDRLNVLKMDVEGHEWGVLPEIVQLTKEKKLDQFLLELHLWPGWKRGDVHSPEEIYSFYQPLTGLLEHFDLFFTHVNPMSTFPLAPSYTACCLEIGYIRKDLVANSQQDLPLRFTQPPEEHDPKAQPRIGSLTAGGRNPSNYLRARQRDLLSAVSAEAPTLRIKGFTMSSQYLNQHRKYSKPELGVDGNLNSVVHTDSKDVATWWRMDLRDPIPLKKFGCVRVYNRRDYHFFAAFQSVVVKLYDSNMKLLGESKASPANTINSIVDLHVNRVEDGKAGVSTVQLQRATPNEFTFSELEVFTSEKCGSGKMGTDFLKWRTANEAGMQLIDALSTVTHTCQASQLVGGTGEEQGLWAICGPELFAKSGGSELVSLMGSSNDFTVETSMASRGVKTTFFSRSLNGLVSEISSIADKLSGATMPEQLKLPVLLVGRGLKATYLKVALQGGEWDLLEDIAMLGRSGKVGQVLLEVTLKSPVSPSNGELVPGEVQEMLRVIKLVLGPFAVVYSRVRIGSPTVPLPRETPSVFEITLVRRNIATPLF